MPRVSAAVLSAVFCLLGFCCAAEETPPAAVPEKAPNAVDLLVRVNEVYRNCASYRDTGTAGTIFFEKGKESFRSKLTFTTAFRRPDRFRFEYKADMLENMPGGGGLLMKAMGLFVNREDRYIVHSDASGVRTWWSINKPKEQKEESLDMALAGATGVSKGTAHNIPALLFPWGVTGRKVTFLKEPVLLEDAVQDGFPCHRISEGKPEAGAGTVLWIDKASLLIRRIDEKSTLDSGTTTEETILHKPETNCEIPDRELAF